MKALDQSVTDRYALYNGDSAEVLKGIPDESVDYIVYSPPFASLFTYSASDRDLGNSKNYDEFSEHYRFITRELYRVLKPGRLLSFHCMLLPKSKSRDGVIGLRDFRGDLIRIHEADGFTHHSEVVIYKDPVTAMQRTKAIGLLYKQLKKDSVLSRQGIPDYLITMRKAHAGDNAEPVTKDPATFPVTLWQRYADPVWFDIDQSKTLTSIAEEADERHLCALQLEVIERAVRLWTNPGDVVLSPFAGIGSEGHVSITEGRRFIGVELKPAYFKQAVTNLERAVSIKDRQGDLFAPKASGA